MGLDKSSSFVVVGTLKMLSKIGCNAIKRSTLSTVLTQRNPISSNEVERLLLVIMLKDRQIIA